MSDLNVRTMGGKDCEAVGPSAKYDCNLDILGDAEIVMMIAFNPFHFPNKCLTNLAAWKNCRRRGSRPLSSDLQITLREGPFLPPLRSVSVTKNVRLICLSLRCRAVTAFRSLQPHATESLDHPILRSSSLFNIDATFTLVMLIRGILAT